MSRSQFHHCTRRAGLGLMALVIPRIACSHHIATSQSHLPVRILPRVPRSRSAEARERARHWYHLALGQVIEQQEDLSTWDPQAAEGTRPEAWRQQMMAGTQELGRAPQAAELALQLARTREEKYQAALLLTRIECDGGRHKQELAHARLLVALAPDSAASLRLLRAAALHNGLPQLAADTLRRMASLSHIQAVHAQSALVNEPPHRPQ